MQKFFLAFLGVTCFAIAACNSNKKAGPTINQKNTRKISNNCTVKNMSKYLFRTKVYGTGNLTKNNQSNLYRIKLGNYYGVIDEQEQEIIPPIYEYIGYSGEGLIRVFKNKKWGYIDKTGKIITSLKYDYAYNFSEGLSAVKMKDKWAFIDSLGTLKSMFKYTEDPVGLDDCNMSENEFRFNEGMMAVMVDDKYGFIDNQGNEVIMPQYKTAGVFSEGLAPVTINGKIKFIDKRGKTSFVIPSGYGLLDFFNNGLARIYSLAKYEEDYYYLETGYINKFGKIIIPVKYTYVTFNEHNDMCYFHDHSGFSEGIANLDKNGRWGFVDKNGKSITEFKYDDAGPFSDGMAPVAKGQEENKKWGFIDKAGKEVIPLVYELDNPVNPQSFVAPYFSEGMAVLKINDKWGCIDKSGKTVIPFKYESITDFSNGIACVELNAKWGCIDKSGKTIIPFKYESITDFSNGIACVKLNGKYGFINKKGKVIIPLIYNDAREINNMIMVKLNYKYGLLNINGNKITAERYDDAFDCREGACVKANNKWGYVNKTGEILKPKYDEISVVPFSLYNPYF